MTMQSVYGHLINLVLGQNACFLRKQIRSLQLILENSIWVRKTTDIIQSFTRTALRVVIVCRRLHS